MYCDFEYIVVCDQIRMGVTAIFGPTDPLLGVHINSICEALDIPYLDARIDISHFEDQHSTFGDNVFDNRFSESDTIPMENSFYDDSSTSASSHSKLHSLTKRFQQQLAIHLHPSQLLINNAFQDVMRFLKWSKFAIIYETRHGMQFLFFSYFVNFAFFIISKIQIL